MSLAEIFKGNAAEDGKDYQFWFIGDLDQWSRLGGVAFDPDSAGLRSTDAIEIKWATHKIGDTRPGGWAPLVDKIAVSLLIQGRFTLMFRDPVQPEIQTEHTMEKMGDYVLWREDVEHTWRADVTSIILTIRWKD